MHRRVSTSAAVAALAAAALALPATAAAPASASTPAWTATATRAVSSTALGAAHALPGTTHVSVTVGLALRNRPALQADIARRVTLTHAQWEADFAPTSTASGAVASYLERSGFTGVAVSPDRLVVTANGTAAAADRAFHTTLDGFTVGGRHVFANVTRAMVPTRLASSVVAVLGLNDLTVAHSTAARPATNPPSTCLVPGVGYPCTYNPQGLQVAYDATSVPTGAKTTIGIVAEGNLTQVVKDLRTEEKANGLPQVPYTIVHTGLASSDTAGADEWDLDTQYSTGMAQTVKHLYIYDGTSLTDSDLAREFNAVVSQDVVKAASVSLGECEAFPFLDGSMLVDDEVFASAAVQGQTFFVSSGDTGGFCPAGPAGVNGIPAGAPDVNYPASSPYVVAVGGTTLVTGAKDSYSQELAWVAGGGGPSAFEYPGAWQDAASPLAGQGYRTVPDIANDADPNSGANVYISGTPTGVGGTSLAAPLTLGEWARIESAHGNRLGFAAPLLYQLAGTAALHDITLGDTGPYPATPGYDLATGLGTLDVAHANRLVK